MALPRKVRPNRKVVLIEPESEASPLVVVVRVKNAAGQSSEDRIYAGVGHVVAIGADDEKDPEGVRPGDRVIYGKGAADKDALRGFHFLHRTALFAVVPDGVRVETLEAFV
jgi:hypothetical protein